MADAIAEQQGGVGRLQGGTLQDAVRQQARAPSGSGVGRLQGGTLEEAVRQQRGGAAVGHLTDGTMEDAARQQREAVSPGIGYGDGNWKDAFMADTLDGSAPSGYGGVIRGVGHLSEGMIPTVPKKGAQSADSLGAVIKHNAAQLVGTGIGSAYGMGTPGGHGGMAGFPAPAGPSGGYSVGPWQFAGGPAPARQPGMGFLPTALQIAGQWGGR